MDIQGITGARIALAFSGGLDTSVMIKWLQENFDAEIVTVSGHLGQEKELQGVREKALALGAVSAHEVDLREAFVSDFAFRALKAGALYEGSYPLATALGRPLLAKALIEIANNEGCSVVAHGCTGKGNDQVRFETTVSALAPDLRVIAPVRHWEFRSREQEIAYCQARNIDIVATKESPYSIDENIWGTSIECGVLEDPAIAPPADAFQRTVSPEDAPDTPTVVTIAFERGVPVALNNERLSAFELVSKANQLAGSNGIGRIDLVENRLVGIKSRELYEAPGATLLHVALRELERLTLDKLSMRFKERVAGEYADLIYNGLWYSPLRSALDAFLDEAMQHVTGEITLQLYKGNLRTLSRYSPFSLYDKELASYTEEDTFDHRAGEGFSKIFALPLRTIGRRKQHHAL